MRACWQEIPADVVCMSLAPSCVVTLRVIECEWAGPERADIAESDARGAWTGGRSWTEPRRAEERNG